MTKLYEISSEINHAVIELDEMLESGEIDSATYNDSLCALFTDWESKAGNVIAMYKNLQAEADMHKAESVRIMATSKAYASKAESLKKYLKCQMLTIDKAEIKDGVHSAKIGKARKVVDITIDEEHFCNIPDEYLKVVYSPKKTDIKKALDAGKELDFAELKDGEKSFSIK